jgi:hypothetical protein
MKNQTLGCFKIRPVIKHGKPYIKQDALRKVFSEMFPNAKIIIKDEHYLAIQRQWFDNTFVPYTYNRYHIKSEVRGCVGYSVAAVKMMLKKQKSKTNYAIGMIGYIHDRHVGTLIGHCANLVILYDRINGYCYFKLHEPQWQDYDYLTSTEMLQVDEVYFGPPDKIKHRFYTTIVVEE